MPYPEYMTDSTAVVGVAMKAVLNFVVIFVRLYYTHSTQPEFSFLGYVRRVLFPVFSAALLTLLVAVPVIFLIHDEYNKLFVTSVVIIASLAATYFVGLNNKERKSLKKLLVKHRHA